MKKAFLMLAVGGVMLVTPSCKKGENDPALSLSSRKARISGEWNVASYEATTSDVDGTDLDKTTTSFDGTNVTSTWSSTSGGTTTLGTGSDVITVSLADMMINKDGSYEIHWNQVSVNTQTIFGFVVVTTTTSTNTEMGSWSFVGKAKVDEYKNKERVVMNATHSVSTDQQTTVTDGGTPSVGNTNTSDVTYEIGENSSIFDIDMLKGKEMTLMVVSGGIDIWSSAGSGGTSSSTTSSADTWTMQLTAK